MAEEYKEQKTVVTETVTTATKPREDGAEAFPNNRKGAFPWWIPLLLLLCLVPLIYAMTRRGSDAPNTVIPAADHHSTNVTTAAPDSSGQSAAPAPVTATASTPGDSAANTPPAADAKVFSGKDIATGGTAAASAQGEPLSDVTQLTGAADRAALIGRKVKLTDAKVLRVVTDRVYFVGNSDQQQVLVLLDKDMNAGAGPQRVKVMPNGVVSLTGVLEAVPTPEIVQEQYGLSKANFDAIGKQDVYLHATVVQKKDNLGP